MGRTDRPVLKQMDRIRLVKAKYRQTDRPVLRQMDGIRLLRAKYRQADLQTSFETDRRDSFSDGEIFHDYGGNEGKCRNQIMLNK